MWEFKIALFTLFSLLLASSVFSFPRPDEDMSMVVTSTEATEATKEGNENDVKENVDPVLPKIYQMDVNTNISNRFAKTEVVSRVRNLDKKAQEATFSVILPEKAYISGFIMEIDGKSYEAYIKEKEEAKKIYDEAVASGIGAAQVAASARDSNRFTVSVNVEPQSKAVFHLKYEELLQRVNEKYDLVINIHPGQPIANLNVEVHINETRPLKFVKAPSLRTGNEVSKNDEKLDPKAQIDHIDSKTAVVTFKPDIERQKELAKNLGTKEEDGLAGQFIVQYDVERDPQGGEVLLQDGYFVHFFAPTDLKPLPKLVVFVLDTSGSMGGIRIKQLKEAMNSIVPKLTNEDVFHIVEFGSSVKVWNIDDVAIQYDEGDDYYYPYYTPDGEIVEQREKKNQTLPSAFSVSDATKDKANQVVEKLSANGGTDIQSALKIGLELIAKHKENTENKHQPIIVFLTDGEPTVGEVNTENITSTITELNKAKSPIFSLSFGDGADRDFLQKISLKNQGFARHIYEAADASLQLQEFYQEISSPLLKDVKFEYINNTVTKLTRTEFPIYFSGSEIIVAGKTDESTFEPKIIRCFGDGYPGGEAREPELHRFEFKPVTIERPVSGIERIWAYLTVKQILEERDAAENKTEFTQKALDIALKYSFVTPVTSLVVVKPNDTSKAVDTEDASKVNRPYYPQYASASFAGPVPLGLPSAGFGGGHHGLTTFGKSSSNRISYHSTPFSANFPPPPAPFPGIAPDLEEAVIVTLPTTEDAPENTVLSELKASMPWIESALSGNETGQISLTIPKGTYNLGIEADIKDHPECPKTPTNGTAGVCTLLKDCPQVYTLLVDIATYSQYFCELTGFAGVCCPPEKH